MREKTISRGKKIINIFRKRRAVTVIKQAFEKIQRNKELMEMKIMIEKKKSIYIEELKVKEITYKGKQKDRWRSGEKKNIKMRGPDHNIQHLKSRKGRENREMREHQRSHSREKAGGKDKMCYWLCLKDEITGDFFCPLLHIFLYFLNFL